MVGAALLKQFFVDDAGELSCMRLMAFLAFAVVLGVWVWGNLVAGTYVPLGYAEAGIVTAAIAGKAAQARFEYGGSSYHNPGLLQAGFGASAGPGDSGPAPIHRPGPQVEAE